MATAQSVTPSPDTEPIASSTEPVATGTVASTGPAPREVHRLALLVIAGAQLMIVLDGTIVNVALPSIRTALKFSDAQLTWVLNAYTLAFGGLLLLGGRLGDVLGRRRMFLAGIALFILGSLLGGVAPTAGFLLVGRVIQGIGGALASPTALALIATTFREGPARNRAMGVYAAVSGGGAALGLILGGVLTDLLNWRWVLFVNVPIGIALILVAPRVLPESARRTGRFDFVGAIGSTLGVTALVYGFIHAAEGIGKGEAGWSSPVTLISFALAAVLLVGFVLWERRNADALLPIRLFSDLTRSGAYLLMLIVGSALFGMFFFVSLFVQDKGLLGFSPLKAGFAFLPVAITIGITAQLVSQVVARVGARRLLLAGSVALTAGLLWMSRLNVHSTYVGGLLGPMIVIAVGLGCIFVPITLAAVAGVGDEDTGVASAMINVGQQVGGSLGLSTLLTVSVTAGRNYAQSQSGSVGRAQLAAAANAHGYATAFLTAAVFGVAGILVTLTMIRVRTSDAAEVQAVPVG